MADGDQGILEFWDPNDNLVFRGVLDASVTITAGITPNAILVSVPPFDAYARYGYLIFRYGQNAQNNYESIPEVRRFTNVVMDSLDVDRSGGKTILKLRFLDRRWMWRRESGGGQISGEYNIARKNEPIPQYEKTPRELAELCLEAMGETNYNVESLPEDQRPLVKWSMANAAQSLARLCDLYSCQVALMADDSIVITKVGEGELLPAGHLRRDDIFDPKEMPKKLRCVTAPVEWQVDLLIEPVGPETDEDGNVEFIPIEELSYRPGNVGTAGGIGGTDPLYDTWLEANGDFSYLLDAGLDEEYELAVEHILKTWRITIDDDLSLEDPLEEGEDPPDEPGPNAVFALEEMQQLLPLISKQVETVAGKFSEERKPAIIWGNFVDDDPLDWGRTELADPARSDYSKKFHYDGRFRIDEERGLVLFPEQMLYYPDNPADRNADGKDGSDDPVYAKMFLRCTVNLRDKDSREPQRAFREVDIDPESPSGVAFDTRDDVLYQFWKTLGAEEYTDNKADAEEKLDFYLEQVKQRYVQYPQSTADYEGFLYGDVDGSLRQVTYQIDASGKATTRIEFNREDRNRVLTHEEFRKREELKEALEEREREKRDTKTTKETKKTVK